MGKALCKGKRGVGEDQVGRAICQYLRYWGSDMSQKLVYLPVVHEAPVKSTKRERGLFRPFPRPAAKGIWSEVLLTAEVPQGKPLGT